MSELRDAIKLVDADLSDDGTVGLFEARTLVVEAARRWVAVQEAITEEGSHPSYHQSVMARHQREWPTLWAALVTTEDKDG